MLWTTIKLGKSCIKLLKGYHMIAPPRPSMISAHVPVTTTTTTPRLARPARDTGSLEHVEVRLPMGRADEHAALGERPHFRGVRRRVRLEHLLRHRVGQQGRELLVVHPPSRALRLSTRLERVFDLGREVPVGQARRVVGGEGGHVFSRNCGLALEIGSARVRPRGRVARAARAEEG